jgi:phosphatidylglycerol:prolipoprotein diacylglycerol transferase
MRGVSPDDVYSIAVWAIIGGVVGARLVHVVDHWGEFYQHDPTQIIAVWNGGIGIWGGILGGFVGGVAYAAWARHPIGVIADITAPALLLAQTIGRLGDIVNGEHCARALDSFLGFFWTHPDTLAAPPYCANGYISPDGVGAAAHPVILYEILWNTLSLAIVWQLRGRLKPDGMLFAVYLALYSVGRFAITFFRQDRIWALGMQEAHFIALAVLVVTVPLLIAKARPMARAEAVPVKHGTRAQRRRRQR